jgi:DNA-binding transcriptional LysR family regulator
MIDLTRLQAFLFAAETLNFAEAGKHLHLTQPTISHHIKMLETELGVELFDRSGSPLTLTEAGYLLLPRARKLIHEAIEMREVMSSLQQEVVGHLRIACSTTAGKYILPQLAARFCERHPWIQVSILACSPELVVPRLLEGEANLGVVSYEACGDGLECQDFFEDAITMIVPAEHPWARRQFLEPDQLLDERMIIRGPPSGTRQVMLAGLAKHDISLDDLNVFLELGNAEAIVRTVASGYGVSFVSRLSAACPLERGHVVEVPVRGLELRRKIYMIRRELDEPNRAQDTFWGFVHDPANIDLLRLAER